MGPPAGANTGTIMGPPQMAPPNPQVYDFPGGMDDEPAGKGKKKRETKKKPPKEKEPKPPKTPKTPKTPKAKNTSTSSGTPSTGQ